MARSADMRHFLARIGPAFAASFTPDQLAAVELHFAMRSRAGHAIDWRKRLGFGRMRGYVVLLAGRERVAD